MLIGKNNSVSKKILAELQGVYPAELLVYSDDFEQDFAAIDERPPIILLNLLDLNHSEDLIRSIRKHYPVIKIVGIHVFENESIISAELQKGLDDYIPLFHFSELVSRVFQRNVKSAH